MPRALTLHIGTPKSGATQLQATLAPARKDLRRHGILYPGGRYLPRDGFNQQPAVYALAGPTIGWLSDAARENAVRYFRRLCREVHRHDGRVLLSAEALAFFTAGEAEALLDRLGFAPDDVTVVVTARDLGRLLPSIWQQNVANGSVEPFESYLTSVASLRERPGVPLWTAFGLPGLVDRWAGVVGDDRVVLVTSPHPDADQRHLWDRFVAAGGLPEPFAALLPTFAGSGPRALEGPSLTAPQTELLRQLNRVLALDGYPHPDQQRLRRRLLRAWMHAPTTRAPRLGVPAHLRGTVRRWAVEDAGALQESGVRVEGTLRDLEPQLFGPRTIPDTGEEGEWAARDLLTLLEDSDPSRRRRRLARTRAVLGRLARRPGRRRLVNLRRPGGQASVTAGSAAAPATGPRSMSGSR